jgi:hypothetical protein
LVNFRPADLRRSASSSCPELAPDQTFGTFRKVWLAALDFRDWLTIEVA